MILRVVPTRDRALWATLKVHPDGVVRTGRVAWRIDAEPALCLYVREGALLLRCRRGTVVGLVGAGDLLGRGGGGAGGPFAAAEAVALRPCRVVPVPAPRVEGAMRRGAATLPALLGALEREAELARGLGAGSGRDPADVRLARVVREAADRIGEESDRGGEERVVRDVTHRMLAEWAGLHRSTVTTRLNEWIYEGIVRQEGRGLAVPPVGNLPGEGESGR